MVSTSGGAANYSELFEGKFTGTHRFRRGAIAWFYYHLSAATPVARRMMRAIKQAVASRSASQPVILDVGCGGGIVDLTALGYVVGVDISFRSLQQAKVIYPVVAQVNLARGLPLPDHSVDVIVCSEVMGHIHLDDKSSVYREMRRVLRPGGYAIFSIETAGDNWLTRWLRRRGLYEELWIDYEGHIGMETPRQTIERLSLYLVPVRVLLGCTWVFPVDIFLTFEAHLPWLRYFRPTAIRRVLNLLLGPLYWLSLHLARFDSANDLVIVAQRPSD